MISVLVHKIKVSLLTFSIGEFAGFLRKPLWFCKLVAEKLKQRNIIVPSGGVVKVLIEEIELKLTGAVKNLN